MHQKYPFPSCFLLLLGILTRWCLGWIIFKLLLTTITFQGTFFPGRDFFCRLHLVCFCWSTLLTLESLSHPALKDRNPYLMGIELETPISLGWWVCPREHKMGVVKTQSHESIRIGCFHAVFLFHVVSLGFAWKRWLGKMKQYSLKMLVKNGDFHSMGPSNPSKNHRQLNKSNLHGVFVGGISLGLIGRIHQKITFFH